MQSRLGIDLKLQTVKNWQAPKLESGELHLWWLPLALNPQQAKQALPLLNDSQHSKYQRHNTTQRQQHYLAGRYFLYQLLALYNQTEKHNITLSYTRLNKPYLQPNPQQIHFNYTDTNGYGLFAFAKDTELGIDVELLSRSGNFQSIVNKRFSSNEVNYVTTPGGNIDTQRFLAYWTRKEAYGKALGLGINFKMQNIDLHSDNNFIKEVTEPDYTITQIQLPKNHIGCIAYQGHSPLTIKALTI